MDEILTNYCRNSKQRKKKQSGAESQNSKVKWPTRKNQNFTKQNRQILKLM